MQKYYIFMKKSIVLAFIITFLSFCNVVSLLAQESRNSIDFKQEDEKKEALKRANWKLTYTYRIEVGYEQDWLHSSNKTYQNTYLHGGKIGATVDFNLPYNISLQTGLFYKLTYGTNNQHFRSADTASIAVNYLRHQILWHRLQIPVQVHYTQTLWRKLSMHFFFGPKFNIGLAMHDKITLHIDNSVAAFLGENGVFSETYDRYAEGELRRFDLSFTLGGGFTWDRYRLQAGYDFGVINQYKKETAAKVKAHNWSWFVGFSLKL